MTGRLKFYGWGYENTGLSDAEREHLFRFVADHLGIELRLTPPPEAANIALRAPRLAPPAALANILTSDPYERSLHIYGKSYPEAVRAFACDFANAPDLVALPASEADVAAVLNWASGEGRRHSVRRPLLGRRRRRTRRRRCLRRRCEPLPASPRPRARGRRAGRAARIQGGIRGPAIEAALKPHGLAIRHYPQSFESSTLGGRIATRSGGHFATLYTHIDDFVESLRTITPAGAMDRAVCPAPGPARARTA